MKKLLMGLVILSACTKSIEVRERPNPVICDPPGVQYNLNVRDRDSLQVAESRTIKLPQKPPMKNNKYVFLVDFDGHTLVNSYWYRDTLKVYGSGLSSAEQEVILDKIRGDFRKWNVLVTTNEEIYNKYHVARKQRLIITETWQWTRPAGGYAYIGSLKWTFEEPCFVFSGLLGYNLKAIGTAASHELAHTAGLHHQALWSGCTFITEYNPGNAEVAPIMGRGYDAVSSIWWVGYTPYAIDGCPATVQDDVAILSQELR